MSDLPLSSLNLQLLLVDPDPIFRLGLRVALETIPYLQVVADVPTDTAALQVLAETITPNQNQVNLIVLELENTRYNEFEHFGLQFCRQLKALYPHIPILLLSSISTQELLSAAKNIGINGYCPKGISISELVPIMQEIAKGGYYWRETTTINPTSSYLPFARIRNHIRLSGINHINKNLSKVTAQLKIPGLPLLDKAILAGQRRELLASRWLVNKLLSTPEERQATQKYQPLPPISYSNSTISKAESPQVQPLVPPLQSPKKLQSIIFTSCRNKLQFSLQNLTDIPLEIDILREDKKIEILYIILQKVSQKLDEIDINKIQINQLPDLKKEIIKNLWESAMTDFYGNFSQITVGDINIEIVNFLLKNATGVETEILNKIPLVEELFSYLLWQADLYVDNKYYTAGSETANSQASMILENLLIQVANGVLQPLLNFLADVETIKQNFYDRHLISTREIEKFRNNLSWKYRLNNYLNEPQAMFESRYELFVFAPRGIAKISIYSPRNQELAKLSGVPLAVTLLLEFRDAIAPRLQSILSFLGNGIVFVLTQIIGRGLGLVARGVLQGIGSVSLTEKTLKRNIDKQNNNEGTRPFL